MTRALHRFGLPAHRAAASRAVHLLHFGPNGQNETLKNIQAIDLKGLF
ncbi:hypothetical protein [Variovorax paradoxus]